ncbi:MAG: hypothetical protein QM820_04550 [Minicystis sp.]
MISPVAGAPDEGRDSDAREASRPPQSLQLGWIILAIVVLVISLDG